MKKLIRALAIVLLVVGVAGAGDKQNPSLPNAIHIGEPLLMGQPINGSSVEGVIDVKDPRFGAKCDIHSGDDIATVATSTTLNAATDRWTKGVVGQHIRVFGVGGPENLRTTVTTTVGDANHITVADIPDYAATGNGVIDFTWHGATVTYSDCTWGTSSGAVSCPGGHVFPSAAPAMWDSDRWAIKLHGARAGNLNALISTFVNTKRITVSVAPSLTKNPKVALWGTGDSDSFNAAFLSFLTLNSPVQVGGHVIVSAPDTCVIDKKINIWGAIEFNGPSAGGKPYLKNTGGDTEPPTGGLVSFIPTPAPLTITAITNPSAGLALVTTSTPHGLEEGQVVEISNVVTVTAYNSPPDGDWIVASVDCASCSATKFQVYLPMWTTGLAADSTGTVQPRTDMIEVQPYYMGAGYPPTSLGPAYFASVHDLLLVGDSSNPPGFAVHFNGNAGMRFGQAYNLTIGTFAPTFLIPPNSSDSDPRAQFVNAIGTTGVDASPMLIANVNVHSYRNKCLDRSTNLSFTTALIDRLQCNSDHSFGSIGLDLSGAVQIANSAFTLIPGPVLTLEDSSDVISINNSYEANGKLLEMLRETKADHSISFMGGDDELCGEADAYDGVEVSHTITRGSGAITSDKKWKMHACVGATNSYTGPGFTWAFAPGANTHFTLDMKDMDVAGIHTPLQTSLQVVPTSSQNSDILLSGQFRTGQSTNIQQAPFQNWLNSPSSTVSFSRYDHPPTISVINGTNFHINQGGPTIIGDALSMGRTDGQLTVAQLPDYPKTVRGLVPGTPMFGVACGGYWRFGEAAGNVTDLCNANTGVASGITRTYSVAGTVVQDTNTAISFDGNAGMFTVAPNVSLPSTGTWSACVGFTKAVQGTQMVMIGQKLNGFVLQSASSNLINVGQVGTGVIAVSVDSPITDGNPHFVCASSSSNTVNLVLDGVSNTTLVQAASFAPADSTLYFATDRGIGNFYNGKLDEPYVSKTALTITQMISIYQEWMATKYGRHMWALDGTVGVAGVLLVGGGAGAAAYYNPTGWIGLGY